MTVETRRKILTWALILIGLFEGRRTLAQPVVGQVNVVFPQGNSLFCNPLLVASSPGSNDLNWLFPGAPDGMSVSLWDAGNVIFNQTSVYSVSSGWSQDFTLYPGQGALASTPSTFTGTFAGEILLPDGSTTDGLSVLTPPPAFTSSGTYLLSSKLAVNWSSDINSVFIWVVGRQPQEGEQFTWFDITNQTYLTTTFSSGGWNNGGPALSVGEAAFFHLLSFPTLKFAVSGGNVVLSWSTSATNFTLETASTCSGGASWNSVTNGIVSLGGSFVLTNAMKGSSAFFRLRSM
jgi:hypothetical protein